MGYGRAGHYGDLSWWRDPEGRRGRAASADVILNDLKGLKVGDALLDGPGSVERIGVWRVAAVGPGTGCHRQDLSAEPGEAIRYLVEGHGGGGKIVVTV